MLTENSIVPIKILVAEDFHVETGVIQRELNDVEFNYESTVVSTEDDYRKALHSYNPDVILSPYSLATTNAVKLLSIARDEGFETPFILLAFDLSEDIAIDLLAEGVEDYVQRSTLKRLPVAIKKALQRHKTQLELHLSARLIKTSEESLRNMVRNAPIAVAMFDLNMNYMVVSQTWLKHENKTESEIIGRNHYEVVPELPEHWKKIHQKCLKGEQRSSEKELLIRRDGRKEMIRWKMNPWYSSDGTVGGAVLFIEDITESVETREALEKTAESLALAQSIAKMGSWSLNAADNSVTWSDEMFVIHGLEKQPLSVDLIRGLTHPQDLHLFDAGFESLSNAVDTDFIYRIVTPSGELKHVRGIGKVTRNADGNLNSVSGIVQDVSKEMSIRQQLEHAKESLLTAQSIAKMGSWNLDATTDKLEWSDEMFIIHDLQKQEVNPSLIRSLIHPDDQATFDSSFERLLSGNDTAMMYRVIIPSTKDIKYLHAKGRVIRNENGDVVGMSGTVQDVSDRIVTQLELERSQASLMAAQSIAKIGSWEWNVGSENVDWSNEMYNIYERKNREVTIADVKQYIHPEDRKRVGLLTENDLNDNINRIIEYRILLPSGKVKHVISVAEQVHDDKGEVIKLVGTLQDVTEQVNREEQIRTLSLVASETINGVLIHDPNGSVIWSNKGFTQITGYSREEIIGNEPWSILSDPKTNAELVKETYEHIKKGEPFSSENQLRHKDGHTVWVSTTFTPVKDESGNVTKVVSIGTDITRKKEIEELQREALSQLEKDNEALKKRAEG